MSVNSSIRRVLAVVFVLFTCDAAAQPTSCAPPAAPSRPSAKLEKAIPASNRGAFTPAVLSLSWKASDAGGTPASAAAYVVEAGSAEGLKDVGETTLSSAELALTMPMPNGTFYLRVRAANACGISAPSPEVRTRVDGSTPPGKANPLVVLNTVHATRERLGKNAFVRVMGQVRNGWKAAPAALVTITAKYEGNKGGLGVTQSTFANGAPGRLVRSGLITDTVIAPGETGCFVLFAQFDTAAVTGLELVAAPSNVDVEPLAKQVEVEGAPAFAANEFDDLIASGSVKNAGQQVSRRSELWIEARDQAGRVLDCRGTAIEAMPVAGTLEALQSGRFRSITEAPFSMSRMVRWWATWITDDGTARSDTAQHRALTETLGALLADAAAAAPEEVARARDALRQDATQIERAASTP